MLRTCVKLATASAAVLAATVVPPLNTAASAQECACTATVDGEVESVVGRVFKTGSTGRIVVRAGDPVEANSDVMADAASSAEITFGSCSITVNSQQSIAISRLANGQLCAAVESTQAGAGTGGGVVSTFVVYGIATLSFAGIIALAATTGEEPASP